MIPENILKYRFSGYLPVVIDIETSGFDLEKNAILEIAAFSLKFDDYNNLVLDENFHAHLDPFEGAVLDPKSMEFLDIHLDSPFRFSKNEKDTIKEFNEFLKKAIKKSGCKNAVIVAHNATFDHGFLIKSFKRNKIKPNFHSFGVIDTATLTSFMLGENVLLKACRKNGIYFDEKQAHGALYDAKQTALLFCSLTNNLKDLRENK
ncbi:MAG: exonuclease domain-containing protein [Psittacicella sp.]